MWTVYKCFSTGDNEGSFVFVGKIASVTLSEALYYVLRRGSMVIWGGWLEMILRNSSSFVEYLLYCLVYFTSFLQLLKEN